MRVWNGCHMAASDALGLLRLGDMHLPTQLPSTCPPTCSLPGDWLMAPEQLHVMSSPPGLTTARARPLRERYLPTARTSAVLGVSG